MDKIIAFFSNRYISILVIIMSFIVRVINVLFVSYYGRDKMFLVMQSKSLLEGKGLGVPQYLSSNTITPIYDFTPLWPPGYPVLLAPFLKLFNYDIYWATTTLEIISCIGLLFIVRRICRQIGLHQAGINMMTLNIGCFEYPFINESLPTDSISVVLFLIGLSLLINLSTAKYFSIKATITTAFFLFLPCFFRYSHPAILLALLTGVLFFAFMRRDDLLKKKAWWLFAFSGLFLVGFLIMLKLLTGHAGYATPTERGFYPENIIHWFPVIPSSFINIAFLASQANKLAGISFKNLMQWLEIINVLAVISLLVIFFKALFRKKTFDDLSPLKLFLIFGAFSSIGIFALLGYMSLTYKAQQGFLNNWNYVYEPRYYAFVVLFLQLSFIATYFIYQKKDIAKSIVVKIIVWTCFITLFVEIIHNIYFHTKVALNFKKYKSAVYRELDYSYYISLINEIGDKYPGYEIWAAAPGDNFYQYLATSHGYIGIADAQHLKETTIKVKKKTILLLTLFDHEIAAYTSFLSAVTVLNVEKRSNSNFYLIELKP